MNRKTKQVTLVAVMIALIVIANLLDKLYSQWLTVMNGAALAVCALISISLFTHVFNKFRYAAIGGAAFGFVSFVLAFIFPSLFFQNPLISILPRLFIGIIGFGAYKLAKEAAAKIIMIAEKSKLHFSVPIIFAAFAVAGLIVFCSFGHRGWLFFIAIILFALVIVFLAGLAFACITVRKGYDKLRVKEHFALTVGTVFTVVANTALVLTAMYLFQGIVADMNPESFPNGGPYGALADVFAVLSVINFIPELIITAVAAPIVILGVRRGLGLDIEGNPKLKKIIKAEEFKTDL